MGHVEDTLADSYHLIVLLFDNCAEKDEEETAGDNDQPYDRYSCLDNICSPREVPGCWLRNERIDAHHNEFDDNDEE